MYGDMSTVRRDAALLTAMAQEMRGRAQALRAQSEAMGWNSGAARAFRVQIALTADDLGRSAAELDNAATELRRHAAEVDKIKALIREAEQRVRSALDDARTVAAHAVKNVREVAENAVTGFMTFISEIATETGRVLKVSVYTLFGREIAGEAVSRAQTIAQRVPRDPARGSVEWLDLKRVFDGNGW